ncbi:MAG: hypothetical protein AAF557_20395 [Pseudomonadota bacterium]
MVRKTLLFAALGFAFSASANAATLPDLEDSYVGSYDASSAKSGSNYHSFWLPSFLSGQSNYWQFDPNDGRFDHVGPLAKLTGRITNNTQGTAAFDVDVNFSYTQKGGRAPKCEFGNATCNSIDYQKNSAQFEYFSLGSATLTGVGDLAGLILGLTIRPSNEVYPPQLGYGANNKKNINHFGLSTWFYWNVVQNSNNLILGNDTRGDINIKLAATDRVPQIPLPAPFLLLLTALGGFGVLATRRSRAA